MVSQGKFFLNMKKKITLLKTKNMIELSKILFRLMESEKYGFVEVPDDWEFIENNNSYTICSCGKLVNVTYFPYAFDEENNEVHYIGICPECGDFVYFCD